jgi:hypothetical protein
VWGRLLAPSYSDFFLIALILWLFASGDGWKALLLDGDTGWHIRTGEHILATGSVPQVDLFSYSKPAAPWFAWEWLVDVLYAVLHGRFGLAGVVAVSGVVWSSARAQCTFMHGRTFSRCCFSPCLRPLSSGTGSTRVSGCGR